MSNKPPVQNGKGLFVRSHRDVVGKGSSRFVNHSQEFEEMHMQEQFKMKGRMSMDDFKEKHKAEFEELFGFDNEEEMKTYRAMLDAEREKKLAKGRNHADLREKLKEQGDGKPKISKKDKIAARIKELQMKSRKKKRKLQRELGLLAPDDIDSESEPEVEEVAAPAPVANAAKRVKVVKEGGQPLEETGGEEEAKEGEEDSNKFLLSKFHDEKSESEDDESVSSEGEGGWKDGWDIQEQKAAGGAPGFGGANPAGGGGVMNPMMAGMMRGMMAGGMMNPMMMNSMMNGMMHGMMGAQAAPTQNLANPTGGLDAWKNSSLKLRSTQLLIARQNPAT